jgi:hypothetical protein
MLSGGRDNLKVAAVLADDTARHKPIRGICVAAQRAPAKELKIHEQLHFWQPWLQPNS